MSKCCCSDDMSCCETENSQGVYLPIPTRLSGRDILGAWKVRWGIGRMNYKVEPGLYKVNEADCNSPVLVSANYKLTFDTLRKNLSGLDCWLLILDTRGVNVWCAAGAITVNPGVSCAAAFIFGWLTGKEPACGCSETEGSCCG